jgi:hypothetical protein
VSQCAHIKYPEKYLLESVILSEAWTAFVVPHPHRSTRWRTAFVECLLGSCSPVELNFPCILQEQAYEESQKYKEGKYIIEKARMMKENW